MAPARPGVGLEKADLRATLAGLMRMLPTTLTSLILLSACVREIRPPPARELTLAGHTVSARDWADVKVCQVDPAVRQAEFVASAELLEAWLKEVPLALEGWNPQLQERLEEGQRELPAYLDSMTALRNGQVTCPGDATAREATARAAAAELAVRTQLDEAARNADALRERAAVVEWNAAQDQAETEARQSWCPTDSLPKTPEVYYAREDAEAKEVWYFCDGTRVVRFPGEERVVKAPEETERKRRPADRQYLSAAQAFPAEEIQRAPNRAKAASAE